jgi:hypothetical protein
VIARTGRKGLRWAENRPSALQSEGFSPGQGSLVQGFQSSYALNMCILITGDCHWRCDELAEQIVNRLLARYGPGLVIVHGGAPGVDNAFARPCRELGIVGEPHLADWKGLGNIAGPERNREMVEAGADLCIALHRSMRRAKGRRIACARR